MKCLEASTAQVPVNTQPAAALEASTAALEASSAALEASTAVLEADPPVTSARDPREMPDITPSVTTPVRQGAKTRLHQRFIPDFSTVESARRFRTLSLSF